MQSINLYQAQFKPDRSPLILPQMLLFAGVFVLLLICLSAWWWWEQGQLQSQLQQLQSEQSQLTAERDALAAASRDMGDSDLERELTELRREIAARKSLSQVLGDDSLGNSGGYSAQLRALAQASDSSFALSEFRLLREGRYITMAGSTRVPAAVPSYLQKLQNNPAFASTRFGVLSLAPNDDGTFAFSVSEPKASGAEQ